MSVGKASIARAVNAEKTAKTEEKVTEVKVTEKPTEVKTETGEKAAEKKTTAKAPAKKTTARKAATTKTTAKKTTTRKTTTRKTTAAKKTTTRTAAKTTATKTTRKTAAKKAEPVTEVYVQYWGKEIHTSEVADRIKKIWTEDMGKKASELKDLKIYIKPEDNGAHYVINGDVTGFIGL